MRKLPTFAGRAATCPDIRCRGELRSLDDRQIVLTAEFASGPNTPKPLNLLAFTSVYQENLGADGSCSGQIATGEML
jgi:hypothetical protein